MHYGFLRIFKVIRFSYAGFKTLWRGEESFRHEVLLGVSALAILIYLNAATTDIAIFIGLMFMLFSAEALNTGLERIADKIDSSINDFTKDVKDVGAVAVFFIILMAVSWFVYVLLKFI